ncbi:MULTISPECIES: GNAT family N-acetyltransferase [Bacteria]|uniref:GNAT family N-acetyltransferase n=1 Tax=Bacteria TaxID=2 RepID=UPI003C7C320A
MVTFRPALPDDADAHAALVEYFAARAADFPGHTYSPVFPTAAAFTPPAGVLLLVEEDGAVVGCGGIRRIPVTASTAVRYEVKHVFLRPETRGRGWGGALLDELERRAAEWGAHDLVLDTHHTLKAAGHLYRRNGYVEIEPYNDNPNATRWYRKTLG